MLHIQNVQKIASKINLLLTFVQNVHKIDAMRKTKSQIIRKTILYLVTFIILGGVTYGIIIWNRNKQPDSFERQEVIVSVVKPVERNINEVITISGYVESNLMAPAVSFVNGRVVKLNIEAGDMVKKDDIIASISPANYADIKAPESGIVLTVAAKEGDMVQVGTLVAVIGDPKDNCVNADVPEKYSNIVKIGQKAVITHKDTGKKYNGEVTRIEPYVNPKNKTFKVKINIDNLSDNEVLMVGSSVSTDIILNEHKNVYSIPISCLNSSDLLYSVKNGVVVSEETGDLIMDEKYVMVQSEKRNTEFIIRGQNRVFPGQRVKTQDYKDSQHE